MNRTHTAVVSVICLPNVRQAEGNSCQLRLRLRPIIAKEDTEKTWSKVRTQNSGKALDISLEGKTERKEKETYGAGKGRVKAFWPRPSDRDEDSKTTASPLGRRICRKLQEGIPCPPGRCGNSRARHFLPGKAQYPPRDKAAERLRFAKR